MTCPTWSGTLPHVAGQEMFCSERTAGGRFQVSLESDSNLIVLEAHESDRFPWAKLRSMWRLAEVPTGQALLDVGGDADVAAIGMIDALEDVDELHEGVILTVRAVL